jgi:hypothetical protein
VNDLLEDAIRAGIERGMDEAPNVGDLAQRVRATPQPRRPPWFAAAAAAAVVAAAVGVTAAIEGSRGTDLAASPSGTGASVSGPVSSPPSSTDDPTTAARAVGTWVPVWIADHDGPTVGPSLTVSAHPASSPTGYSVTARYPCPPLGGGRLSPTGVLLDHSIPMQPLPCPFPLTRIQSDAFEGAYTSFTRLAVSTKGVLTLFAGDRPVAQLVRPSSDVERWSVTGRLPAAALGTWTLVGEGAPGSWGPPPEPAATITLAADGTLTGGGPCFFLAGSYRIGVDGHASFGPITRTPHSCPYGAAPTWQPSKTIDRVGLSAGVLTLYDAKGEPVASFKAERSG